MSVSATTAAARPTLEESLMLTGDENIVDIDFTVFWAIRDAPEYLFNVEDVDATIKAVAEFGRCARSSPAATSSASLTEDRDKIQQTRSSIDAGDARRHTRASPSSAFSCSGSIRRRK